MNSLRRHSRRLKSQRKNDATMLVFEDSSAQPIEQVKSITIRLGNIIGIRLCFEQNQSPKNRNVKEETPEI